MLPQFVCQDGYFLSHIPDKVILPDMAQVREFLPPYSAPHPLSPTCPVSHGPQIRPDQGAPMDAQRAATFLQVPKVIKEATQDFNRIFGRKYDPFLETYKMDDAQYAFFVQGAHANTCKNAVNHLRKQGLKIGMVRPRWMRPWPTVQIADALSKVQAVASVETSTSYGGAMRGGNLIHELRATLYDLPKRPMVTSFMAGLGGDVVLLEDFHYMAKILQKMVKEKKTRKVVYWIGFEDEKEE
jgi:pyruvate ferredoxin oxidoreductase alpha subunit/oxalate oxidoreductase subunit alpha